MKDDSKGKVIFSLIAGATAGIVAGLLLAPETGDDTRSNLRKSASKWGGDLSKLVKNVLAKAQGIVPEAGSPEADVSSAKAAADRVLQNLGRSSLPRPVNAVRKRFLLSSRFPVTLIIDYSYNIIQLT